VSRERQLRSELLLLRYRAGEESALQEFVALWERPLFYYIRRLADCEEDAWDMLQEVWLRVIRNIGTLRNPAALTAWLYTIARHTASNHLRDTVRTRELHDAEADLSSTKDATEPSLPPFAAEELHQGLGQLSLLHREVLTLHFLEGFSLAEIAVIVDAPVGTVKSRLYNAKKALRKILETEVNHE